MAGLDPDEGEIAVEQIDRAFVEATGRQTLARIGPDGANAGQHLLRVGGKGHFADTLAMLKKPVGRGLLGFASRANTVIGVVATNAKLTKAGATKVAQMAQNGIARTVRPAHTMLDGDVIFTLSTGGRSADVTTIGAFAAEVMAQAVVRAVTLAKSAGGLPGLAAE